MQLVLLANESDGEDEEQAGEGAEQEGEQAEGGQAQPEQGQPVAELEEFDEDELDDLFAALQVGR